MGDATGHATGHATACALCGTPTAPSTLAEAAWVDADTEAALRRRAPTWRRADGACPACVQQALLTILLERGEAALGHVVQAVWPLDAEAAFGALPTPLRMRADPRFTGRGVTVAVVDAGFYPHADLRTPTNRIRAWVDAGVDPGDAHYFGPHDDPRWPGWDAREPLQWHGLMTSAAIAGNGALSHGLYRGMAPDAELVLVQARDPGGRITSESIARALRWVDAHAEALGIALVNVSLGGEAPYGGEDPVGDAVARLVERGVAVIVAAGNDGVRSLTPPATCVDALTVGGLDDRNVLDAAARALWHANFGTAAPGWDKPELVAPSVRVVAPVLPGTDVAEEARRLFAGRATGDCGAEARIAELRLVTPHYQHVEGTSFAAPIVAGTLACMREALDGRLSPRRARELLAAACHPVPGAPRERQGAGALDAGRAVALALAERAHVAPEFGASPAVATAGARFYLHDHRARSVHVVGSWDGWRHPGTAARELEPGNWEAHVAPLAPGEHAYKLVVDLGSGATTWLPDPRNARRVADGFGGWNSVLAVPASA